jgi:hypothetical protein
MKSKLGSLLAGLGKAALKASVVTIVVILTIVAAGSLMRWVLLGNHKSARVHGPWSFGVPTAASHSRLSKQITRPKTQATSASKPCDASAITSQMQPGDR